MERNLPTEEQLMQMGIIYQEGGEYPKEARRAEDQYIHDHILEISAKCLEENDRDFPDYVCLEDFIGIYRGSWQCKYGFYRTMEVIRRVDTEKVTSLAKEVMGESFSETWITTQNLDLGGSSPNDLIKASRANKVIRYLESVREGF